MQGSVPLWCVFCGELAEHKCTWIVPVSPGSLARTRCFLAICYRHTRDLGDDRHFLCPDHWQAQADSQN